MIHPSDEARAPRPSRRRGRRLRLKADEAALRAHPVAGAWLETVTALLGEAAMADGHVAAREGAVRSLDFKDGRVSGPVEADSEAPRNVAITLDAIDDAGWNTLVTDMAAEALYTARLLEGEMPEDLGTLFERRGMALVPGNGETLALDCDKRVMKQHWRPAALAWIAAERLATKPLEWLVVRGLAVDALLERLRHHRTLRHSEGTEAHPMAQLDPALVKGTPLTAAASEFWRCDHPMHDVSREVHPNKALLRRLGGSSLGGKFPLCGLLATIYEEIAEEASTLQDG